MIALIGSALELIVLIIKLCIGSAAQKDAQAALLKQIQEKCNEVATNAETAMRERNRRDQAAAGSMQDRMDQEAKKQADK